MKATEFRNGKAELPPEIIIHPGEQYHSSARKWQGIPGIEISSGGRLWATWYSGGKTEGADNYALLVTSNDNGNSWTEPVLVVAPGENVRAYDPALWHDPQGRMWFFWAQCYSYGDDYTHDGKAGVWAMYTEDSNSASPAFTEPRRIANGVMMNKPIVLSNGEWALPTAVWQYFEPHLPEMAQERFSNITVSEDNGKTFYLRGGADVPERCFDEHMIIEKKDGTLWMMVRTYYGIGESFSDDMGKTWTPGERSNLVAPCSRFYIRRLPSGNLLFVNHAGISVDGPFPDPYVRPEIFRLRKRSHLLAWLSDDDGKTWKGRLLLDERNGVSYPDGCHTEDGRIYVVYDYDRYGEKEILMASFTEEDILAGKCVNSDSRLKVLINKAGAK